MPPDSLSILWQGQERFHGAFRHSGIGMALVSLEGKFLDVNPALCRFLGYTEEELCNLDFQAITHPGDLAADLEHVERVLAGEIETYTLEKRYIHKDGCHFWGLLTVSLARDEAKNPLYFISQIQDITDRRKADEALWISRERLRRATSAGGVGTWDFDARSETLDWNDVTYEIHGVNKETFAPGKDNAIAMLHPDDAGRTLAHIRECMANGARFFSGEYRIVRPDGEARYVRSGAEIFRDAAGRPERVVGVMIDLTTEKRALEAAQAADQAKSDFLAMTSHEIRTPMSGMLGFASLLGASRLDETQRSYLDIIEASGRHLLEVINDILDFSRIEAGSLPVERMVFDVRECVRNVFEIVRPAAARKTLDYRCEVDSHLPGGMVGDQGRLAQILTNILGNAVKFTEQGFVHLHVSGTSEEGDEWTWKFSVRDSGPGVPSESLARIFDPFFQAKNAAFGRQGGSGLGLAISRRLAELLGGGITVTNLPMGGAEFAVIIRAEAASVPVESTVEVEHNFCGSRILVVEDNDVNRRLCGLQLQRLGCEPVFACNGREAVERARDGNFAAILMDVQLPELDGCNATKAIRFQEAGNAHIPIIAMTANAMPEDRERCLAAGMSDYLTKPVRVETLGETLARWLGRT